MKKGWEIKRLGEVCDLQNGFAFKSTDYIEFSNTVNFRMSQIRPGGGVDLENNPKYLPDEYAITYKDYLLKEGDIVIAMTDMATETKILGVPTIVPSDSRNWLLNQRVGKLFNIDKSKVNIAFLKYILVSEPINEYYKKLGRGGLQINIGKQDILNAKIPLPPLPEQQRIVSILDEAFAAIAKAKANAEQNLKNAKELFESYLQGVFEKKGDGWEERSLEELADESCTLSYGIVQPGEEFENGLPVIRPTDLTSRYINVEGLKRIDPKLADGYKRTRLIGDELLLCVRGTTGVVSIATPELKDANVTRGIVPIRFNSKFINQEFGYYLLIANYVQRQIRAKTYGAALMQINIGDLRKILTPYPPLKDQQTIVRQLDALRAETQKLEAVYQKKIADLEELKKSILQKAFAGELRGGEAAKPKTEKSRRDDKIIENKINHPRTNPEGVL